jgi:hypothetical protein
MITHFLLSETAYSIFSHLSSISGGRSSIRNRRTRHATYHCDWEPLITVTGNHLSLWLGTTYHGLIYFFILVKRDGMPSVTLCIIKWIFGRIPLREIGSSCWQILSIQCHPQSLGTEFVFIQQNSECCSKHVSWQGLRIAMSCFECYKLWNSIKQLVGTLGRLRWDSGYYGALFYFSE